MADPFPLTLGEAARGNAIAVVKAILYGADPNERCERNQTPLWWAAAFGNYNERSRPPGYSAGPAIEALLAAGADPNDPPARWDYNEYDSMGWYPIHFSAYHGDVDAIRALAAGGANLDVLTMDAKGHTPLMVAARGDQVAAMEALALNGADVTARSRDNDNLWTVATFGACDARVREAIKRLRAMADFVRNPGASPVARLYHAVSVAGENLGGDREWFTGWDEGVVPRLMIEPVTGRVTRGSWFERLQPRDNGLGGGDGRSLDSDVGLVPSLSSSSSSSSLCSDDSQDVTRAARHLSTRCAVYILGNIPVELCLEILRLAAAALCDSRNDNVYDAMGFMSPADLITAVHSDAHIRIVALDDHVKATAIAIYEKWTSDASLVHPAEKRRHRIRLLYGLLFRAGEVDKDLHRFWGGSPAEKRRPPREAFVAAVADWLGELGSVRKLKVSELRGLVKFVLASERASQGKGASRRQ